MTLEELEFTLQAGRNSEINRHMGWQASAAVHIEEHVAAAPVHCCHSRMLGTRRSDRTVRGQ